MSKYIASRHKKSTCKSGTMSKDEKDYIRKFMGLKSDAEIGKILNRAEVQIERYRKQILEESADISLKATERTKWIEELHRDTEWDNIKKQFTKEELITFENSYAEMMFQFKEVYYTEKEQIFSYITTKIKLIRHNIEVIKSQKDIERMERLLEDTYDKAEYDKDNKSMKELLISLEQQLAAAKNASFAKTKEYKELSAQAESILGKLKATREQRIKKVEDSKHNIIGLLKFLDDQENRKALGIELLLADAAAEQEKKRLTEYHTYADGTVDRPILLPETIESLNEVENES